MFIRKVEKVKKMKTIELLNKVVELGFSREKALADIDASLDEIIGAENRKDLSQERRTASRRLKSKQQKNSLNR
jgi:hypothetical protein